MVKSPGKPVPPITLEAMVIVMVLLSMMKVVLQLILLCMVNCMDILSIVHIKKGYSKEVFDLDFDIVSKLKPKMYLLNMEKHQVIIQTRNTEQDAP
ncbi:MAG: hypothetical protein ACOC3T_05255 [Bacteroidota bacterium]